MDTIKINNVVELAGKSYTVKSVELSDYDTKLTIDLDGGSLAEWLRDIDAKAFAKGLRYYTMSRLEEMAQQQADKDLLLQATVEVIVVMDNGDESRSYIFAEAEVTNADCDGYGFFGITHTIDRFDEWVEVDEDTIEEVEDPEAIAYNEKLDWLDSYKHQPLKGSELEQLLAISQY